MVPFRNRLTGVAVTVSLTVLFAVQSSNSATFFVTPKGSDSNNGRPAAPWRTIQHAVDGVNPGDTVLVKTGTYHELVRFNRSGSETAGFITLKNAPGESPVMDGAGLVDGGKKEVVLVMIENQNYVRVEGFEICNLITSDPKYFPAGIWVRGTSHHVQLIGNRVHHIRQETKGRHGNAHGIAVYGTSASGSIHDILIDGNEIWECRLGSSESMVLNGNVEDFIVRNNRVHDNNNIAYDFIGHERVCPDLSLNQARNGLVADNIAYNIDSRLNASYGSDNPCADGFYVDGGKDIVFERNRAYGCNIGFEVASEHGSKSTSGIIVRNNLIYNNHVIGLAMGGYDAKRGSARNNVVVNNTFYQNNSEDREEGAELLLQYYCTDNTFKNNIVVGRSGTPMVRHESRTGSNNLFDGNLYYCDGKSLWKWNAVSFSTFEVYRSGSGLESNSIFGDPRFNDARPLDFRPAPVSPAVDRGENLSAGITGSTDFNGNPRVINGRVDMGAVESTGP
jgi:hypothetical protein